MLELSSDLREFIHLLNTRHVKYMIVGAWALAFHARPRYTGDLDVFVECGPDNAPRLMEVIEDFGFGGTGIRTSDFLTPDYVIQLGRAPNRIDLLTGISGVSFEEAWPNHVTASVSGLEVTIINRKQLIQYQRDLWHGPPHAYFESVAFG